VQALESTWRAIELLVRRLDTDGDLDLFILDVARDRVAQVVERLNNQRDAANPESWALIVSLHAFAEDSDGAEQLASIAMAARALGSPFVAGAPASFAGRASALALGDDAAPSRAPEVYQLIRQSIEATFLGLTFPRFLVRAPYGKENPCDAIDFEEIDDPERHEDYLWASGATLIALLVGQAFNERGWAIGSRLSLDVDSLPYFTYRHGPETVAKSCAEVVMSERIARHLLECGIMPIAWIKDTDRVRLVELRPVASASAPFAASWAAASGTRA
jgi:type VI secretion system protein ImpC